MRWAGRLIHLNATGKWTRLASPETRKALRRGLSSRRGAGKPSPLTWCGRVSCFVGFLTHAG